MSSNDTNVDVFGQDTSIDFDTVGSTFAANASVALLCILFMGLYRERFPALFSPRRARMAEGATLEDPPRSGLLSWVMPVVNTPEADVLRTVGTDAVVYLRFLKLAAKLAALMALYGLLVILPINYEGEDVEGLTDFARLSMSNIPTGSSKMWAHLVGAYLLSALTIALLWREYSGMVRLRHAHLRTRTAHQTTVMVEEIPKALQSRAELTTYFKTLYGAGAVSAVSMCQDLSALEALVRRRDDACNELSRVVLREKAGGPPLKHTVKGQGTVASRAYWEGELARLNAVVARAQERHEAAGLLVEHNALLKQGSVTEHRLRLRSGTMTRQESSLEEKEQEQQQRERLQFITGTDDVSSLNIVDSNNHLSDSDDDDDDDAAGITDAQPTLVVGFFAALRFVRRAWATMWRTGASTTTALLEESAVVDPMVGVAFVSFSSLTAATTARQVVHVAAPGKLRVREAPIPSSVHWPNVRLSQKNHVARSLFVWVAVGFMIAFWAVPVTTLNALLSVDSLSNRFDWLGQPSDAAASLLEFAAPLALLALMALLPPVLGLLSKIQGYKSVSELHMSVLHKYFIFQVVNVLLLTTFAGSFFESLDAIWEDPSSFATTMGTALPAVAGFFLDYLLIKTLSGCFLELVRFASLLQAGIRWLLRTDYTHRDIEQDVIGCSALAKGGGYYYGKMIAEHVMVLVIVFTYANVAPLLLPAGALFFLTAWVTYKRQLLYVYVPEYEMGGRMWPLIVDRCLVGLLIAHFTLVGVFTLKEGYEQASLMLLPIAATWAFKAFSSSVFREVFYNLPMETAVGLDQTSPSSSSSSSTEAYVQPALTAPAAVPETGSSPSSLSSPASPSSASAPSINEQL